MAKLKSPLPIRPRIGRYSHIRIAMFGTPSPWLSSATVLMTDLESIAQLARSSDLVMVREGPRAEKAARLARPAGCPIVAICFSDRAREAPPPWADFLVVEGEGALGMLVGGARNEGVLPLAPSVDPSRADLSPWPRMPSRPMVLLCENLPLGKLDLTKFYGERCTLRKVPPVTIGAAEPTQLQGIKSTVAVLLERERFGSNWSFLSYVLAVTSAGGAVIATDELAAALTESDQIIAAANTHGAIIQRYQEFKDIDYRERFTVRARRTVYANHTMVRRLEEMLSAVGFAILPPRRISVLLCTKRPELLDAALKQIERQDYPAIELILCLHGIGFEIEAIRQRLNERPFSHITVPCPEEWNLGQCLNMGLQRASGYFIAKMDDDDFYGPNHLTDLVQAYDFCGGPVVGKWATAIYFQEQNVTVYRHLGKTETPRYTVIGGTMLSARPLLANYRFMELPTAVDRTFFERLRLDRIPVFSTHGFGFVYHRHSAGHTWAVGSEYFENAASAKYSGFDDNFLGPTLLPSCPGEGSCKEESNDPSVGVAPQKSDRAWPAVVRRAAGISPKLRSLLYVLEQPEPGRALLGIAVGRARRFASPMGKLLHIARNAHRNTEGLAQVRALRVDIGRRHGDLRVFGIGGQSALASAALGISTDARASDLLIQQKPDLILVDARKQISGADDLSAARERWPAAPVCILTSRETHEAATALVARDSDLRLREDIDLDDSAPTSIPPLVGAEVLTRVSQSIPLERRTLHVVGCSHTMRRLTANGEFLSAPPSAALDTGAEEACAFACTIASANRVRLYPLTFADPHHLWRTLVVLLIAAQDLTIEDKLSSLPLPEAFKRAVGECVTFTQSNLRLRWHLLRIVQDHFTSAAQLATLRRTVFGGPFSCKHSILVLGPQATGSADAFAGETAITFAPLKPAAMRASELAANIYECLDNTSALIGVISTDPIDVSAVHGLVAALELAGADLVVLCSTARQPTALVASVDLLRTLRLRGSGTHDLAEIVERAERYGARLWREGTWRRAPSLSEETVSDVA